MDRPSRSHDIRATDNRKMKCAACGVIPCHKHNKVGRLSFERAKSLLCHGPNLHGFPSGVITYAASASVPA
jgi:hypothetical protein